MHFNFFCTMITKNCSRLTCQLIPWCKLNGLIECSALNVRNLEIWEFLILVVFLKLVKGFCSPWCDHMFCAIRFEFGFVLRFELFLFCFTKHRLLVKHECCGSNDFQDYFDDAKESRVKQVPKNQESKSFKNQVSRIKIKEQSRSRFKTQDSRIKRRLNQDKY